jgi:two-component system sensor histidine kinase BaeS
MQRLITKRKRHKLSMILISLDLMLPDMSGESVCTYIRKNSQIPIIMLTARNMEDDMIHGLDIGADDYITKPFSLKNLYAIIIAVTRRSNNDNDFKFLNSLNVILAVVGIISIVFAAIAGIILAGKISVPVKAATRAAKDIARGNYNNRINTDICTMELSELGNAVNHMAESLDNQEMLRRRLTSDVAHELRTPVANVSSNIEAIIEGVLEPTNERLSSCYNELERITGIITELEKLRQIEGENMILHIGHVDIYELAKEVKLIFENEMSKKNIRCDIIGEHIDVCVDKDKMSQVLNNLISNAVKYTDNYGNIQITVIQENENVVITVEDNGCGIDDNDIQYIFERFYRTDKSRNRSTGGAGIGLTITRAIVQLHGGTIHVESKKGVGSLFKVTIPANKQI